MHTIDGKHPLQCWNRVLEKVSEIKARPRGKGIFSPEHRISVQSTVKWFDVASFG